MATALSCRFSVAVIQQSTKPLTPVVRKKALAAKSGQCSRHVDTRKAENVYQSDSSTLLQAAPDDTSAPVKVPITSLVWGVNAR